MPKQTIAKWDSSKMRHRRSDPETSREAAAYVVGTKLKPSNVDVLKAMKKISGCTQYYLECLPALNSKYSPSRIRSAVSELRQVGLVKDGGGRIRLPSGRRAVVWEMVETTKC